MKKRKLFRSERGQSLIIIAVVMVGMIAVMGLAIDGGNLFMERRRAQNAADAAALAGTRLLSKAIGTCGADPVGTDAVIAREVNRYAERNGISDTNGTSGDEINANVVANYVNKNGTALAQVGAGLVPDGATGVDAQVRDDHQTYFVTVVGIDRAGAAAQARAMTGAITQFSGGGGILPFAVHIDVVEGLPEGETFRALDITNHHSGGTFCVDENGNGYYQDEGIDTCVGDTTAHNAHRGWLNLNYIYNTAHLSGSDYYNRTFERNVPNRPCGSDDTISTDDGLQGWASRGGCPYPFPIFSGTEGMTNGDFIHGSPGARQSSLDAIEDTFEGHTGYAPLFDYIYTSDYMSENFPPAEEPGGSGEAGWPQAGGGEHAFLYHIVGFVAIGVQDVGGHGSDHYLEGVFQGAIIGDGTFQPGDGFDGGVCQPPLVYGVSLWN